MEQYTATPPGNNSTLGKLPSNRSTSSEQPSQPRTDKYSELDPSKLYTSEGESHYNIHYLGKPSGTGNMSHFIPRNPLLSSSVTRVVPV